MESYIKRKVSTGFYGNATEVIRDAIRRMQAAVHLGVSDVALANLCRRAAI
jgi:putative addiction module CopG family antidote